MVHVSQTIPTMPTTPPFETRLEAGRRLAREVSRHYRDAPAIVLGIPRGGVPVGLPIALTLDAPLDVIVVRKIPIPWEPEAGFGAVTADGTIVLNEEIMPFLGLAQNEIEREARVVQAEIQRRTRQYRGNRPPLSLQAKTVFLTDDGLATGYTMIAAIRSVRQGQPERVVVAAPAAPRRSIERVSSEADDVICLIVQEAGPFAVASFYRDFPDLTDAEVTDLLQQAEEIEREGHAARI